MQLASNKKIYFLSDFHLGAPNFSASLEKNDAVLRWQTATETNSAWFSIQRSNDGIHFNNIGKVKAAGNSSRIESYAYTDMDAAALQTSKL